MLCLESSQVDQYTSGNLVSREKNHIHIAKMVFRKAINKLRNLVSRNSTVSTSSKNKQVSTKSVPPSSKSDDDVQFRKQTNKQKQAEREGRTKQANKISQRVMRNYNFKRIGNKKQLNFNLDILDAIQESIHHVENNNTESAHSSLTSISKKLKKRNKLIRIADKSEAGWLTIEEYQNDSAASGSDDFRQAKQRAL